MAVGLSGAGFLTAGGAGFLAGGAALFFAGGGAAFLAGGAEGGGMDAAREAAGAAGTISPTSTVVKSGELGGAAGRPTESLAEK